MNSLESNYLRVKRLVPSHCCLIAVSKGVEIARIQALYDLGQRDFGESRLQEAQPKIDALPKDIIWHFIGHMQSNKARRIGEVFHVLHSVSSENQLQELAKLAKKRPAFIEVNIAEEPQKAGVLPSNLDVFISKVHGVETLDFRGLMTIGPAEGDLRPYFKKLAELNHQVGGTELSMGMSDSFQQAIEEGATHVRIGSALFGTR